METRFSQFAKKMDEHLVQMLKSPRLYVTGADKDKLWEIYISSFPEGSNPMYRQRTEHDCSACRHFVRSFGAVVSIEDGKITSIWDFEAPGRYGPVANALSAYVHSCQVEDVFVQSEAKIGVSSNPEMLEGGHVTTWQHMHVVLPATLLNKSRKTNDTLRGDVHSLKDVFKRSLDEISEAAVLTALELIGQNSLYRGEEWKGPLEAFLVHLRAYQSASDKDLYAWEQSAIAGQPIGKIKNHSIGVLLMDISSGMDLDEAVRRYEKIVAPSNYKRPKAIFSERMVKEAEETITELGYLPSLARRHARIGDITVNNILFVDRDAAPKLRGSVFGDLAKEATPKKFDRLEEVPLDTFISEVLPQAQKVEVLLENHHGSNMVSLISPENPDAPSMFKWNNGFSWAYAGNMADSMRQRVKALGGNVEGVLRFSIQWNDAKDNEDDLDAHCIEPNGNHIYFGNKAREHRSSGILDVDIIQPSSQTKDGVAVENITYSDLSRMPEGDYTFFVHCYSHRGGKSGFTAEIEFDGQIYSFAYNQRLRQDERVEVAYVAFDKKIGKFKITEKIPSQLASRKIWGLDTQQFHPVSVIMYSPNYWDGQNGIGNRHVFFMLDGAKNSEKPNGFFNEYLKNELLEHKRVFEALGSKMAVKESEEQLSGVGFSTTQRNELTVKVTGQTTRIIKVKI